MDSLKDREKIKAILLGKKNTTVTPMGRLFRTVGRGLTAVCKGVGMGTLAVVSGLVSVSPLLLTLGGALWAGHHWNYGAGGLVALGGGLIAKFIYGNLEWEARGHLASLLVAAGLGASVTACAMQPDVVPMNHELMDAARREVLKGAETHRAQSQELDRFSGVPVGGTVDAEKICTATVDGKHRMGLSIKGSNGDAFEELYELQPEVNPDGSRTWTRLGNRGELINRPSCSFLQVK